MPEERWVEVQHDDGQWYRAQLLHAYRQKSGQWRAVVQYTVGLLRFYRAVDEPQVRRVED